MLYLQIDKDNEVLNEDDIPKPEKPQPIKDQDMRQNILDKYDRIRRKPGEPKLHPEVTNGAIITQNHLCAKYGLLMD